MSPSSNLSHSLCLMCGLACSCLTSCFHLSHSLCLLCGIVCSYLLYGLVCSCLMRGANLPAFLCWMSCSLSHSLCLMMWCRSVVSCVVCLRGWCWRTGSPAGSTTHSTGERHITRSQTIHLIRRARVDMCYIC